MSEYFSGIATLFAGLIAAIIYFIQKRDSKKQIARLLLMEIRTAEDRISQIKEKILNGDISDLPTVLISNSWKTHSHLFVSDFDNDEMKLINSFYDSCEIIEEFSRKNNNFFWIATEEKAKLLQQTLAKIIDESIERKLPQDPEVFANEINGKRDLIRDGFDYHGFIYSPQKIINELNKHLPKVPVITTSNCGLILKRIAKLKN